MEEVEIVGFKGLHLNELHACYFSNQHLRDYTTHVSSNTGEGLKDCIMISTILAPHATYIDKASEQTWILVRNIPLLPFWGRAELIHNTSHDNSTVME